VCKLGFRLFLMDKYEYQAPRVFSPYIYLAKKKTFSFQRFISTL